MIGQRFEFGDRVRHCKRPEWGVGSVIRVEDVAANGAPSQSISVRFPIAGVKKLSTSQADLERVVEEAKPQQDTAGSIEDWHSLDESDWLAPLAQRKVAQTILRLPEEARDPFSTLRDRLDFTFRLYRFERNGGSLIDWAVAQTGLDDPLSSFTRHELEEFFDRWAAQREEHLARLLDEARTHGALIDEVLAEAPGLATDAVRRLTTAR
jgi:hypothetical protein